MLPGMMKINLNNNTFMFFFSFYSIMSQKKKIAKHFQKFQMKNWCVYARQVIIRYFLPVSYNFIWRSIRLLLKSRRKKKAKQHYKCKYNTPCILEDGTKDKQKYYKIKKNEFIYENIVRPRVCREKAIHKRICN